MSWLGWRSGYRKWNITRRVRLSILIRISYLRNILHGHVLENQFLWAIGQNGISFVIKQNSCIGIHSGGFVVILYCSVTIQIFERWKLELADEWEVLYRCLVLPLDLGYYYLLNCWYNIYRKRSPCWYLEENCFFRRANTEIYPENMRIRWIFW